MLTRSHIQDFNHAPLLLSGADVEVRMSMCHYWLKAAGCFLPSFQVGKDHGRPSPQAHLKKVCLHMLACMRGDTQQEPRGRCDIFCKFN